MSNYNAEPSTCPTCGPQGLSYCVCADEGMEEFYAEYDAEILECVGVCADCRQKFTYLERRGNLHEGGPDLCKTCENVELAPSEGWTSIDTSVEDDDTPF